MKKRKKSIYQRLNKKQQKHIAECYNPPASRITIARIKSTLLYERKHNDTPCQECNSIARTLGILLGEDHDTTRRG